MLFRSDQPENIAVSPNGMYAFNGASGCLLATESGQDVGSQYSASTTPGWTLSFELSEDGRTWTQAGTPVQRFLGGNNGGCNVGGINSCSALSSISNCAFSFTVPGNGQSFRFVRVVMPHSAFEGLQGYLNAARFTVTATPLGTFTTSLAAGSRDFACESDIFEDFYALHPCWYGPVVRQDSSSVMHTYYVNNSTVDTISGSVTVIPWRPEDEACVLGISEGLNCDNVTIPQVGDPGFETGIVPTDVLVETSNDGIHWDVAHRFPVEYGIPTTFNTPNLAGEAARFVRIHADKHPCFDESAYPGGGAPLCYHPALRHYRGMLLDSRFTLTGQVTQ